MRVLIDNCCALFGDEIITLLKDLTEDNRSNHGSGYYKYNHTSQSHTHQYKTQNYTIIFCQPKKSALAKVTAF